MAKGPKRTSKRKRMQKTVRQDLEDLVFPICEWFFSRDYTAEDISRMVRSELRARGRKETFSRQQVYDAVSFAIERGYVQFFPPHEREMATRLADLTRVPRDRVVIVNTRGPRATDYVTAGAAELCMTLIRKQAATKQKAADTKENVEIHLGLGSGYTTVLFAKHLAEILERTPKIPGVSKLVMHAMNCGFSVTDPLGSPISLFHYFTRSLVPVEYVPLFCPSLVRCKQYDANKEEIGVKHAFERKGEIDIVMTSLASENRGGGLLDTIEREHGIVEPQATTDGSRPRRSPRAGDVQFRPFSWDGPLPDDPEGFRAVTLFELEEYVSMAGEDKYIILVSGPTQSGETRSDAVLPLLVVDSLRVWTHLCLDIATATDLVESLSPAEPEPEPEPRPS